MKSKTTISRILLLLGFVLTFNFASAHNVNYYTGTCNSGPTYSVQPNVTNVNSNSNYAWQYKNASGTYTCITNGNNTINGNTYSVTGAYQTGTTSPGPIVFTNPNSNLNGLEIRCLISDGANPCSMPSGNTWTSTSNFFIAVNGTSCSNCNNLTDPGVIGSNESFCGTSFNPSLITNITSPSGGSTNAIEYMWLSTTDANTALGTAWNVTTVSGASSSTYDPPSITQTTWYRRCARRAGCANYDAESNWVMKELSCCGCANNLVVNNSFEYGTTGWGSSGGNFNAGTGAVYCGVKSGDFQITNTGSNWVSQEIYPTSYAAGTTINLSVYAGVHVNSYYHEVFVDYFDVNWNWISNTAVEVNKVLSSSPVGPQLYTFTSTIPAGVGHISVGFSGNGDWIKTDNWCVTTTSPSTTCNPNSTTAASGFCAPSPTCSGSNYLWSQTINQSNGDASIVKLISGSTNSYTVSTGFPAAFSSNVNINIAQVVSYDGYATRNTVTQTNEKWRVIFKKSGTTIYTSPYTNDLADLQKQANWSGSLGTTFNAPNGIDQMIFEHYDVANGYNSPGSCIPVSVCLNYTANVCNNLTSGGTIGNDESFCGASFNPANIVELTAPSGGSGTIEYMWLISYDGGTNYTAISGASSATYDPGVITQTTWYRRCARRSGCTSWDGESNWVKKDLTSCCTATINGLQFKDPTGVNTTVTSIVNGGTYSIASLPSPFNVEALLTGNMESVRFTLSGSATGSNVENSFTWDYAGSGSTWSHGLGTFVMLVEAFPQDNAVGSICATQTYTFTLVDCNNLTSGGTIGYDETICGVSFDPSNIVNVTSPSGGNGPIEYMWLISTDGGTNYTAISGASSSSYNPGPITQTTWYRRCARNFGCTAWVGESNWVKKELKTPVTANAGSTTTLTCSTPSVTLGVTSVAGNSYSWSPSTGLSSTTIAQPIANPNSTTTYTVTVTGSNGCTATSSVVINVNKTSPVAVAGTATNITCSNLSATLGTTSTAGYTYSWSPSTGLSSTTISQPVATPTTTTTYTVTVTGSNGCTATSAVTVTVNKTPPTANAGSATTLTCTSSTTILGTTALAGNMYSWSPATGLNSVIIAQPTANPTATTTYTVTVTGSNGCAATSSVTVTVNKTPPVANPGSPVTLTCTTPTATIGSAAVAGNIYQWSPVSGLSSSTSAQPTANPTFTTTYTLTVTGSNGCTSTGTVLVTVNKTAPSANAGPAATLNCTSTSTVIGSTSISGNTYSWSPATGLSSTTVAQPTASPTSTTTYTVTVTSANGCTATSAVTITVNQTPPTVNAGVDRNLNCTTPSAIIGSTAIAGNTYSWSPATGLSSTSIAQPTANPSVTTNYTVTVTGSNGCTATDVVIVNVNKTPPTANAGNDGLVNCSINSVTLGTTAVSGYTYNWNPFMTLSSNNVAQPIANPTSTTTYTLTVTGSNGCTATDMVTVVVNVTPPSADAGIDKIITCTNPSAVIGTPATAGTNNTYSWSPVTGLSSSTVAQPTATPTTTTTYTVTVTGTNGCAATDVVMVSVNKTSPTVSATAAPSTICIGSSSTITATGGGTYSWSNGATTAAITVSPATTSTYTVTVTGSNGCTATSSASVTVNPTTTNGNLTMTACNSYTWNGTTYTASGVYTYTSLNTSGCLNTATLTLTINNSTTNGNLTITNCGPYTWNGTTYTTSGVYTYTSLNAAGCLNTATLNLTITTVYTPSIVSSSCHSNGTDNITTDDYITFVLQPSTGTLMLGKKYSVTATQAGNPITITMSDGSPATGLYFGYTNAFRTSNGTAGQGNITLTLTAANGCSNTATVVLNDPGTCGTTLPPCSNGTVTYTYRTPYQTTNLSNVALNIPKFDDMGGTRTLNNVNMSYTVGMGTISVLENTSASAITGTTTSNNDATLKMGSTTLLTGTMAPLSSGVISYGAPVLVPAGINSSSWPGDSVSGLQQSTLNRSLKLGLEDYLQSIYVNPTQSLAWVTNITGLSSTATDMNYFAANGTISGSSSYTSPADLASFIGSGNTMLNVSTNSNTNTTAGGGNMVFLIRTKAYAEVTVTYNYSTACYGSVGNYVWTDSNHNGQNDEVISAGLNGVTVQLYKETTPGSGTYTLSQTTSTANSATGAPGYYLFTIPESANYYVHFPSSTTGTNQLTSQTITPATDNNSDASTASGNSPVFAILINGTGVAKNNTTIDAGYVPLLSLGNTVWVDANKNGLKDASEIGMSGATVNLYADNNSDGSPDGAAVATTTTNSNGLYIFNNVFPGNYVVGVVPSNPISGNAYVSSPVNEANPNNNVDNNDNGIAIIAGQTFSGTITLLAGTEPTGETPNNGTSPDASSNLTLDFGFYQPVNVYGNVFVDNNGPTNVDGTGVGSLGSTQLFANLIGPAGNVVAVVPVNSNGTYSFFDVTPNTNYTMVLSSVQSTVGSPAPSTGLPSGWTNVSEDCCDNTGNDGTTNGITTVNVGMTDVSNVNFGVREVMSMGNMVWNDLNKNGLKDPSEIGISGAVVKLYNDANSDGNADGPAIATTTTNSNGLYIFNDLYAGNYLIGVTPPVPTTGNDYESSPVNETNPNTNIDNNDNGVVKLGGETISGTITLSLGAEPTGETPNNGTGNDANSNLTIDFGFYQPVNISGNVFNDINGPTNVDGTGIGAPSGTQLYAHLVNASGLVDAIVPVNPNGTYYFADVRPNTTFTMVLSTVAGSVGSVPPAASLPAGWANVSEDCCDNTGNDGTTNGITTVTVGLVDVPNVNFGIKQTLSAGNLVWNDLNRNGLKETSEPGISGATVKIYADANTDGNPDGAAIATTTTNSAGLYVFNELAEGSYIIGVTPPVPSIGNDFESSILGEETNPNLNIDNNDNGIVKIGGETVSGSFTLSLGAEPTGENPNNGIATDANSNLTIDFGFYQPVNISGNVFVDNNGPTNVDGTGIGAPSGTQLYANLVNASGTVDAVIPVNPNGTYYFSDVRPNTTFTMVLSTVVGTIGSTPPASSLPSGWSNVSEDCCDNTGNDGTTNGVTTVTVGLLDVPNVNFGIRQPLSVGNLVWEDVNRDGLKDASENGISGATVNLYFDANSDGVPDGAAIQTTTSDATGLYVFNGLDQGNYVIGVTPPTGNVYSSSINGQEVNPNLNVDNNDNGIVTIGNETRSGTIILAANTEPTGETPNNGSAPDANSNLTIDFGFFICPSGFTFTPQFVCPGNTLNLLALEPANYTGGVWSQGGVPVTSTNVTVGTYVYTFSNGTCTSTGTVTVGTNVPDYTPTISIAPSAITGTQNVRVIINISEILNKPSCSDLYIFVPRLEPRFTFNYEPTATVMGGVAVANAEWQFFTSNPNFYVWKYVGAPTFPANGSSKLGFIGPYNPTNTDGATTFSVQIFQGSGGETNITNNTDSENLIYFR